MSVTFDLGTESSSTTKERIVEEFEEFFDIGQMGNLRIKRTPRFSVRDIGGK